MACSNRRQTMKENHDQELLEPPVLVLTLMANPIADLLALRRAPAAFATNLNVIAKAMPR